MANWFVNTSFPAFFWRHLRQQVILPLQAFWQVWRCILLNNLRQVLGVKWFEKHCCIFIFWILFFLWLLIKVVIFFSTRVTFFTNWSHQHVFTLVFNDYISVGNTEAIGASVSLLLFFQFLLWLFYLRPSKLQRKFVFWGWRLHSLFAANFISICARFNWNNSLHFTILWQLIICIRTTVTKFYWDFPFVLKQKSPSGWSWWINCFLLATFWIFYFWRIM